MQLVPIVDHQTAKSVARKVVKYNHIDCTAQNVLRLPHFAIIWNGRIAGWVGFRQAHGRWYEVIHMGVLPKYRRHGLAKEAVLNILDMIYALGGRFAFVHINHLNRASIGLAKDLKFRRTSRGVVHVYMRRLNGNAVAEESETL